MQFCADNYPPGMDALPPESPVIAHCDYCNAALRACDNPYYDEPFDAYMCPGCVKEYVVKWYGAEVIARAFGFKKIGESS